MTDATPDAQSRAPTRRGRPSDRAEYQFYFALILICALPIALVLWLAGLVGLVPLRDRNPFRAAWHEASTVAPKLFWG